MPTCTWASPPRSAFTQSYGRGRGKGAEESDSLVDPGSCPLKRTSSASLWAPPLQSSMWTGSPGPLSVLGCHRRLSRSSCCGQREPRAGRGAGARGFFISRLLLASSSPEVAVTVAAEKPACISLPVGRPVRSWDSTSSRDTHGLLPGHQFETSQQWTLQGH